MRKSRWLAKAIGIFVALLVIWIASALVLSVASAQGNPFSMGLSSNLAANYSQETSDISFGPIKLSILREALIDLGLSSDEADDKASDYIAGLDDPVPTATALDFDGNAPLTATPTGTAVPSATPTPSPTTTRRVLATKVPTKTGTVVAVGTAVPVDSIPPVIADPGTITPTPGPLGTCSRKIYVSNVNITDAPTSSGIKWVKMKYKVYDNAEANIYAGYIFSSSFTICSGGPTAGGGWDACYDGPSSGFNIKIYPGFSALPDYTGPGPFKVKLYLITEDNAGNSTSHFYGYYEFSESCDDPAPPTNTPTPTYTPVPTDTVTPSITSLTTSPAAGSVLTSCTLSISNMTLYDPAFSSGISASGVQIKHTRISGGDFYQPAPGVTGSFVSGPGSDWNGTSSGTITLDGLGNDEVFDLYGVLTDIAGNGPVYYGPLNFTAPSVGCP
jgi:hypothetical protein